MFGRDALAMADLSDLQVEIYPPGPGNGTRTDLFDQVGTSAWAARIGGVYVLSGGSAAGPAVAIEVSSALSGVA